MDRRHRRFRDPYHGQPDRDNGYGYCNIYDRQSGIPGSARRPPPGPFGLLPLRCPQVSRQGLPPPLFDDRPPPSNGRPLREANPTTSGGSGAGCRVIDPLPRAGISGVRDGPSRATTHRDPHERGTTSHRQTDPPRTQPANARKPGAGLFQVQGKIPVDPRRESRHERTPVVAPSRAEGKKPANPRQESNDKDPDVGPSRARRKQPVDDDRMREDAAIAQKFAQQYQQQYEQEEEVENFRLIQTTTRGPAS
ncbi:hypothetical protein ABVK25_000317 [Lepraria finkii]|uniref:Uncharacterized protein n=1 Tax=Lepraria finkii TaxID=1340010 RepID=A0ABR4BMT6_9LECA